MEIYLDLIPTDILEIIISKINSYSLYQYKYKNIKWKNIINYRYPYFRKFNNYITDYDDDEIYKLLVELEEELEEMTLEILAKKLESIESKIENLNKKN